MRNSFGPFVPFGQNVKGESLQMTSSIVQSPIHIPYPAQKHALPIQNCQKKVSPERYGVFFADAGRHPRKSKTAWMADAL